MENKTISAIISQVQEVNPTAYSEEKLTSWISELDGKLSIELLKRETPVSYSYPEDQNAKVLVPAPYDCLYLYYCIAMCDFFDREMDRYTNDMQMFNAALDDWKSYYQRTNKPVYKDWFVTM